MDPLAGSHQEPRTPPRTPTPQDVPPITPTRSPSREPRDAIVSQTSPRINVHNPTSIEPPNTQARQPTLRFQVIALERHFQRDLFIKFDAQTNLNTYRSSLYRGVSRSYEEFSRLAVALAYNNPQIIIAAVPLPQSSAATLEDDDRILKANFQRWLNRISSIGPLLRDDELRSFVENDFGYNPAANSRRRHTTPASTKSHKTREDDELLVARTEVAKLETQFLDASQNIEKVSRARADLAGTHLKFGERLGDLTNTEAHPPLLAGFKKLAQTFRNIGEFEAVQATSACVSLGDVLAYQSANARSAQETLANRNVIVEEHREAAKATFTKRRNIERMKSNVTIQSDRVERAVEDLGEAKAWEATLAKRVTDISSQLTPSLRMHSKNAHDDSLGAALEYTRTSLLYEKLTLDHLQSCLPLFSAVPPVEQDVYMPEVLENELTPAPTPTSPLPDEGAAEPSTPTHLAGSMLQDAVPRRPLNTLARRVAVEDRRQAVDARAAASTLAGAF